MTGAKSNRPCPIQEHIKLICPFCGGLVEVPMCQAVNGENIVCPTCGKGFEFPRQPD